MGNFKSFSWNLAIYPIYGDLVIKIAQIRKLRKCTHLELIIAANWIKVI